MAKIRAITASGGSSENIAEYLVTSASPLSKTISKNTHAIFVINCRAANWGSISIAGTSVSPTAFTALGNGYGGYGLSMYETDLSANDVVTMTPTNVNMSGAMYIDE